MALLLGTTVSPAMAAVCCGNARGDVNHYTHNETSRRLLIYFFSRFANHFFLRTGQHFSSVR